MNVLPVIQRELRAQSRQSFTYWLRVVGAGAALIASLLYAVNVGLRPNNGSELFSVLHATLQGAIWLLVPILSADCLSRERREGTLGLLFLTPLKARDIVLAKGSVHGLRAVSLLLTVVPITALPALIGGVSWNQVLASLALNTAAACLALAAGVIASSITKAWIRSQLLAYCFAGLFAIGMCFGAAAFFSFALGRTRITSIVNGFQLCIGINPEFFMYRYYQPTGMPFANSTAAAQLFHATMVAAIMILLCALVVLLLSMVIAALCAARNWQERPPHPLQVWFQKIFCRPVVMQDLLKRWMRRTLDRNPIGWLERRAWSGRLVIWGWFATMVSIYSLLLGNANFLYRGLDTIHLFMGTLLAGSMMLNASGSFRRERDTRVLELLLVSPISEWQIIAGRLRGLWGQFMPSMVLLLLGWFYLAASASQLDRSMPKMLSMTVTFATLPVIGLYASLVTRSALGSLLWAATYCFVIPLNALPLARLGIALLYWHGGFPQETLPWLEPLLGPTTVRIATSLIVLASLHRRLVARRFATESA